MAQNLEISRRDAYYPSVLFAEKTCPVGERNNTFVVLGTGLNTPAAAKVENTLFCAGQNSALRPGRFPVNFPR